MKKNFFFLRNVINVGILKHNGRSCRRRFVLTFRSVNFEARIYLRNTSKKHVNLARENANSAKVWRKFAFHMQTFIAAIPLKALCEQKPMSR